MIYQQKFNRLLHDLKRISIQINLIKEVTKKKVRDKMLDLLTQELDRLHEDLDTLKEKNGNDKKGED